MRVTNTHSDVYCELLTHSDAPCELLTHTETPLDSSNTTLTRVDMQTRQNEAQVWSVETGNLQCVMLHLSTSPASHEYENESQTGKMLSTKKDTAIERKKKSIGQNLDKVELMEIYGSRDVLIPYQIVFKSPSNSHCKPMTGQNRSANREFSRNNRLDASGLARFVYFSLLKISSG